MNTPTGAGSAPQVGKAEPESVARGFINSNEAIVSRLIHLKQQLDAFYDKARGDSGEEPKTEGSPPFPGSIEGVHQSHAAVDEHLSHLESSVSRIIELRLF